MIDVFLTTGARHTDRIGAAIQAMSFWLAEVEAGRARLTVLDVGAADELWRALDLLGLGRDGDRWECVPVRRAGSQRVRHAVAATLARSPLYVLTDDDLVPARQLLRAHAEDPDETWLGYAERVFAREPELAIASALPIPGSRDPWDERLPASCRPLDRDLWDVSSLGGVRVVRQGFVPRDPEALPALDRGQGGGYDSTLCGWLRRDRAKGGLGLRTGYLYRWHAVHLCYGRSEVWADLAPWPDPGLGAEARP